MIFVKDFLNDQKILSSFPETADPLVSVILPTYRRFREGFLERSIRSVLSQNFTDFELLVMDDGSSDGSNEFIERVRAEDPRLIHVRHEQNCGLPALRVNEGIELARGRYLAFQFDDDLWKPNALDDLVEAAERNPSSVIVGRALFSTRVGEHLLPEKDVDLVTLYEQNRFANNSVLFPRSLVDRYGMYDPHIGMRRLCDWDLWLRLGREVPIILLDKVVSQVFEANEGAIGLTVPWDMPLFRYLHSIPRNHLLTLENWRDYPVDALQIGRVEVAHDFRRRLYEEQIVPFYFKMRHIFPGLGSFSATLPPDRPKSVMYTKRSYDVSNEVTVTHYDRLAAQRHSFKSYYQLLEETGPETLQEADLLLLMRTVEDEAVELAEMAMSTGKPFGLHLDDDLLNFHEYGAQFDYLAPGTPYHDNLSELIGRADAVLVTNEHIREMVAPLNPRVLPHNNTIPDDRLPADVHPRGRQIKIGYVGSGYRIEEFRHIWEALVRISQEYKDRVSFEFWGLDVSSLPALASPVVQQPFTFSYFHYLDRLQEADFDILLTPMLEKPRPRLGKSLIKYYETAAAGALGIFSDVPQYRRLPEDLTCLKATNTAESWYDTLRRAIEMPAETFDLMRRRLLAHVREEFSAGAQIDLHEAALRALEFHARTRQKRYEDGKPRALYVLHSVHYGGAEIQLYRRLRLARRYGLEPIVVIPSFVQNSESGIRLRQDLEAEGIQLEAVEYACFTEPRSPAEYFSEPERDQIRELIERTNPSLVHTVTFIPSFGQVCAEMNVPHISTMYAVEEDFAWQPDHQPFKHSDVVQSDCLRYVSRWSELLDSANKVCARDNAPQELFDLGQRKYLESIGQPPEDRAGQPLRLLLTGTFQERKQQLETIEAVGKLVQEGYDLRLDLYGYTHFFPEYLDRCRQSIQRLGLQERVRIQDFSEDIAGILDGADMLLSLSTYESFPGSIKDAFAAGVLVVATPVGGVGELVIDGVSGILCPGTSVDELAAGIRRALDLSPAERTCIAEQGRRIARLELHPYRTANDLFRMYIRAIDNAQGLQPAESAVILRSRPARRSAGAAASGKVKSPASPPTGVHGIGPGLTYTFRPRQADWSGLDVLVGTHMRPASGQLVLTVHSPGGRALRRVAVDLDGARDNDWLSFRFPAIRNASGVSFLLKFELANPGPETVVSLYQTSPNPRREVATARHFAQRIGLTLQGRNLYCREWYDAN